MNFTLSALPAWRPAEEDVRLTATSLAIALMALNLLDLITTNFAIEYLGAVELNPIMAPLVGTTAATGVKVALPAVVVALAATVAGPRSVVALRWMVGIYIGIAVIGVGQVAWALA